MIIWLNFLIKILLQLVMSYIVNATQSVQHSIPVLHSSFQCSFQYSIPVVNSVHCPVHACMHKVHEKGIFEVQIQVISVSE